VRPRAIPDDSHLPAIPQTLKLEGGIKQMKRGRGGQIILSLEAKNDYLPTHESDFSVEITDPHGKPSPTELVYRGTTRLLGGRTRLQFTAELTAELGQYDVKVTLITPNGALQDTTKIEVLPAPQRRRPSAVGGGGLPDIKWVNEQDWPEDWDDDEVGDVQISVDSVTIRVSAVHEPLVEALARRSGNAIASFKNRYLVAVAVALWMQEIFEGQNAEQDPAGMKAARHWMAASAIEAIDIESTDEEEDE